MYVHLHFYRKNFIFHVGTWRASNIIYKSIQMNLLNMVNVGQFYENFLIFKEVYKKRNQCEKMAYVRHCVIKTIPRKPNACLFQQLFKNVEYTIIDCMLTRVNLTMSSIFHRSKASFFLFTLFFISPIINQKKKSSTMA